MTIENDESFIERRKWLEGNRKNYLQAKTIFEDPAACRGLVVSIAGKIMGAFRFDAYKHNEAAAVQEIVTIREALRPMISDLQFIEDYEERQAEQLEAVRAAESGDTQPEGQGVDSEDEIG